jgi:ABC-type transport system involved in multi-copper enzyme maturation permease subunit
MPIFDQGYQHWQGALSGRFWRWLTIARHGIRVQQTNRILRILLLVAWLPALGLIGAMVLWGLVEQKSETVLNLLRAVLPPDVVQDPQAYRQVVWTLAYSFFFKVEMFFIMLLVAVAGPGLISQDLRFNALPLYFARPLTRLDYFLGKLGVIGALVLSVAVGPALFAYLMGVCFSLDLSVIKDTYPVLLGSVAYGLIVTISVGTFILALSSLTRRSLYVGITWAGLWIISGSIATILTGIHRVSVQRDLERQDMNRWVSENPPPKGAQLSQAGGMPYPAVRVNPKNGQFQLVGLQPEQEKEGERWYKDFREAQTRSWQTSQREQGKALRGDWRPMCSYVANLERMSDVLLDTDGAWVTVGKSVERARQTTFAKGFGAAPRGRGGPREMPASNERQFADQMVPQYPWWWSAVVLAVLLGLSIWILTRRVKSLDRLK